jgi:large subunit ribosomal protein L4
MYLAVKQFLAHQRQGTHKAKERGEIKGSTKKIKRQKGTGTARAGSIKSPVFRGGGRVFGPRPRKYTINLNKKVNQLARKSALSQKLSNGQVKVVEDFTMDAPKTQAFKEIAGKISDTNKRLFVLGEGDHNIYLSSRNLASDKVMVAGELNTYSILNCKELILTESSVGKLAEILSK